MGDSPDGSPSAAQRAQDHAGDEGESDSGSLFGRVFSFFGNGDEDGEGQADGALQPSHGPGLGALRRMRVEDVAIPRAEITAVSADIGLCELVDVFRESGNTRLPVYEGTLDSPLGLIHLKDFALKHGFNGNDEEAFDLRAILRPLLYAPPSMPIGVLLTKMQTDRSHMALVIDEYGGVDGLVTIEDLIEQVIGEIEDEHDVDEGAYWSEEKPGCYLALARTPIAEFQAATGVRLVAEEDEEEIDTLGGLVFMEIGRVPARGEVIRHDSGAQFEVVDADPRRIKRLRVRMPGAAVGALTPRGAAAG